MAEAILTDDRRGGDRWAHRHDARARRARCGSGPGARSSAIDRLREARGALRRHPRRLRPLAGLGGARPRARARRSRRRGPRDGRVDRPAGRLAAHRARATSVAVMAGLSATVQVGDTARSEQLLAVIPAGPFDGDGDDLIVGDTERTTSVGPPPPAVRRRRRRGGRARARSRERLRPQIDPNLHSALALAHAAERRDRRGARRGRRGRRPRPGQLPRPHHGRHRPRPRAAPVAATRRPPPAAFDQVTAAADATEDRVVAGAGAPRRRDGGVSPGRGRRRRCAMAEAEAPARRARRSPASSWRQALHPRHGRARLIRMGCLTTRR